MANSKWQIEDENENEDESERFMGSGFSQLRMHWDREPVEGLWRLQNAILRYSRLQICATSERFMERFVSLLRMYWGHEPQHIEDEDENENEDEIKA